MVVATGNSATGRSAGGDAFGYFDHAATTPMHPEAVEAMLPYFGEVFGNPSGSHRVARVARRAIDEARDVVAECIGARPGEIVFTGCGTEADNTAIAGVLARAGGRAMCSAVEHHAVLDTVRHLGGSVVAVDEHGAIDVDALAVMLAEAGEPVSVVSVMAVNNEVGTVQPVAEVSAIVRRLAPGAVVHTDAIQAAPWLELAPLSACTDLMALSGHKFGGPKGVGVLRVRDGLAIGPLLFGGGQERDRRSGTHNVAGIVGLAAALRLTVDRRESDASRVAALRDRLVDGVLASCAGAVETVQRSRKVAGSAHLCFDGCESESLLFLLDQQGICVSAASACASGAMEPSHVLAAMGVDRDRAAGALRFSLGHTTTDAEVDHVLAVLPAVVERVRGRRAP